MGETTVKDEKSQKTGGLKSFFKNLKIELKKIVWPNQETLTKQTIVVVAVTVVLAAIIALLDFLMISGFNLIF